jgi:hypothetical protein
VRSICLPCSCCISWSDFGDSRFGHNHGVDVIFFIPWNSNHCPSLICSELPFLLILVCFLPKGRRWCSSWIWCKGWCHGGVQQKAAPVVVQRGMWLSETRSAPKAICETHMRVVAWWLAHLNARGLRRWACLDGGVSVSLEQTNTKTNTFHPNTCVSLVLVGTNTQKN